MCCGVDHLGTNNMKATDRYLKPRLLKRKEPLRLDILSCLPFNVRITRIPRARIRDEGDLRP